MAIRIDPNDVHRHRPAIIHGTHLRIDQFRVVLVLGEKKHWLVVVRPC